MSTEHATDVNQDAATSEVTRSLAATAFLEKIDGAEKSWQLKGTAQTALSLRQQDQITWPEVATILDAAKAKREALGEPAHPATEAVAPEAVIAQPIPSQAEPYSASADILDTFTSREPDFRERQAGDYKD